MVVDMNIAKVVAMQFFCLPLFPGAQQEERRNKTQPGFVFMSVAARHHHSEIEKHVHVHEEIANAFVVYLVV